MYKFVYPSTEGIKGERDRKNGENQIYEDIQSLSLESILVLTNQIMCFWLKKQGCDEENDAVKAKAEAPCLA